MKHVLITAGTVYGPLDANKLVGNRVRGIWAEQFAQHLCDMGHKVTLLVPDTSKSNIRISDPAPSYTRVYHRGFAEYHQKCREMAAAVDAAVMAAAVVNWVPAEPYLGKMPTKGYKAGDIINVPFILAPHVIDDMKKINPKLTLIGCKMLVNAEESELIEAAYDVLLRAKCNAVVANDMGRGLRRKLVVNQDRTVQEYADDFDGMYANLLGHIEDEHYHTVENSVGKPDPDPAARALFDRVVAKYESGFTKRDSTSDRVFGSVLVRSSLGFLVSPREKGARFGSPDAVDVRKVIGHSVHTFGGHATLNAPLLVQMAKKYPEAHAVLHQHEQIPGLPTVDYAPPGTVRDNDRDIPGPAFNIKGHGFVACLDADLNTIAF